MTGSSFFSPQQVSVPVWQTGPTGFTCINKIAQKVGEEAVETVIEATNGTNERLIYEGADLIYHMIVLLTSKGYRIEDLARELQERHSSTWKKH